MLRRIALARMMSPFVVSCIDSFRDVYVRTGMNLVQSIALSIVIIGRDGWRRLSHPKLRL